MLLVKFTLLNVFFFYVFPSLKFGAYTVYLLGACTTRPWPTQSTSADNSILPLELTVGVKASKLRAKARFDTSTIQTLEWKSKTEFNKEPIDICKFYIYIYIYINLLGLIWRHFG